MHKGKYAIICKLKYAEICTKCAVPNMQKMCTDTTSMHMRNMQYVCIISPKYAFICRYMQIYVLYA